MGGMSVSWRQPRGAAPTAAAAVAAIALAPSLLRAPEPPPLDPDIGLTGLAEASGRRRAESRRGAREAAVDHGRRRKAEPRA